VHPASDNTPRWFPDGQRIAFSSNRFGNPDVFTVNADGSGLKRLTFESSSESPTSVTPDGKFVLATSNRFEGGTINLVKIPANGGDLIRLTVDANEAAFQATATEDGKLVFARGAYGVSAWRKPGVKGSAMGDIWIADNTVPIRNQKPVGGLTEHMELFPMPAQDGTIFFVSNRSGWPNLFRMNRDGKGARQLTKHSDGTLRFPSIDAKGTVIAYDFNSEIYALDLKTNESRKVTIRVPEDERLNPVVDLSIREATDFAVAPDGKRTVVAIRGDLFLIPEKGGTTRRLTTNPGLDQDPVWLDAKTILYVAAGDNGRKNLNTVTIDGQVKEFRADGPDYSNPLLSPDGKQIAVHRGPFEIVVMSVGETTATVVATGDFLSGVRSGALMSWSPDSKHLAVAVPTERLGVNVEVVEVGTQKSTVVARLPRGLAGAPRFLPNGKSVYFSASYDDDTDAFVVDLVPNDLTFTEDDLDAIDSPKPRPDANVVVKIDPKGIEYRLRRISSGGANVLGASADSKTIWANTATGTVAIPAAGGAPVPVPGLQRPASLLRLGQQGKVYALAAGRLYTLGGPAPVEVPFNAQYSVNLRQEERALFEEIWWSLDRFFYDEKMHGKNWAGIRAKFEKVLPSTFDRADFYALMGEMMEELDSSHLGATPPADANFTATNPDASAWLGAELDPTQLAAGRYVIGEIIPGSPADHPQSTLKVGDTFLSIDGVRVGSEPLGALLNRKAGRRVKVEIERAGVKLTLSMQPVPLSQVGFLSQRQWLEWQRAETDRLSGGKLAYLYIDAMNQPSLNQFLREIRTLTNGKEGAVIDVRYNGGGSTAQDILNVLLKRTWLIRTSRGERGFRTSENIMRGDALELPSICLANSYSASNAEIFAEGFRRLGIGKFVGEMTRGYVIGTGGVSLWDGGFIRMPALGSYTVDGENLENNGRKPDIEVTYDPNAFAAGRDPQLERAVRELMNQLRK
jgi:tricorn protease